MYLPLDQLMKNSAGRGTAVDTGRSATAPVSSESETGTGGEEARERRQRQ